MERYRSFSHCDHQTVNTFQLTKAENQMQLAVLKRIRAVGENRRGSSD